MLYRWWDIDPLGKRVELTDVRAWREGLLVKCDTRVVCEDRECITGEATVWLPNGTMQPTE